MTVVYNLKNVVKQRVSDDGIGFRLVVPDIQISAQENIALVGHSGCGKSTLLDMLALILAPDESEQFDLHPVGGGCVLYLTLGHCRGKCDMRPLMDEYPVVERGAWELPVYHELLERGIRWAAEPKA